jgi:glycolate oxidase
MSPRSNPTRHLQKLLGPEQVRTDHESRYTASMDNLRYSILPEAVLFPADEEAVATILRMANDTGQPVTPRGAGSATTGATSPVQGGWVLDLSGWKQLHVDPLSRMAYCQPGVVLSRLDEVASIHGLLYAPDPGSARYATVGGTIATNAGGLRGAKYGVTRDYVQALEGFLPTGEFVRWGADLRKFAAGFNLRDLWIGSEGTLGVITGAVLRLLPRPLTRKSCLAVFPGHREALLAVQQILQSGLEPAAMEFLDAQTLHCTLTFWQEKEASLLRHLPPCLQAAPATAAVLLIEFDGSEEATATDLRTVTGLLQDAAIGFATAANGNERESLWKIRRSCSQAMFTLGPRKLNEDVVVPLRKEAALLDFLEELGKETGLPTPTFGHAADGNFHAHLMFDDADEEASRRAAEGVDALMRKVIELGGAISGEHGIGMAKSPYLRLQHGDAEIRAMQAVKSALDPANILNPGKIWTSCEVHRLPRETVRLPWDH